jgi:DNA-binding response OmpR family regulator
MTTVVLVEDDPDIRFLATMMLSQEGFEVRAFEDGETALGACRSNPPDVALLDWGLPKMSGVDLLRALKAHPLTAEVAAVMLSAFGSSQHMATARRAGAQDYLVKPFTRAGLATAVRGAAAQRVRTAEAVIA